jgi:hypothetical protein
MAFIWDESLDPPTERADLRHYPVRHVAVSIPVEVDRTDQGGAEDRILHLVKADYERATAEMNAIVNRALYQSSASTDCTPPPPPSHWMVIRQRVGSYCSTLWRALRGDDPYDRDGEDEY